MWSTKHTVLFCAILILSIYLASPQTYDSISGYNRCTPLSTCRKCIEDPLCAWCYDPAFNMTPRCFIPNAPPVIPNAICDEEFVIFPKNSISRVVHERLSHPVHQEQTSGASIQSGYEAYWKESSSFESKFQQHGHFSHKFQGGGKKNIVQIAPQRVSLHLRARETYTVNMFYTQAEDYPVDLYYLMDLSRSMYDDKEKLSLLGDQLAYTMKNMTSNFMLGFGSFVDKVVMPYVSTLPEKMDHPCDGCVRPYGYHNHLKLNTNTSEFSRMVKQASVSGNLDAPEGGFDAIMQAIVCRESIGWRQQARHLLVYSTDSGFHYAGDGKLGGIVKPNDGKCHLNLANEYEWSSIQDYPSISQINQKIKDYSINVIFAVTGSVIETYRQLEMFIEGSSTAQLSEDSSNIVELVKQQYEQISSTIEMKYTASDYVEVRFVSHCSNSSDSSVESNICKGVKVGDIIKFGVDIQVLRCPEDPAEWNEVIEIYPFGLDEKLIIELEMLCGCKDCEAKANLNVKSPECHNHGVMVCGVCICDKNAQGNHCECTESSSLQNLTSLCINPDVEPPVECSNSGICNCGVCACFKPTITGRYCQCDNNACDIRDGKRCSGHGICDCGVCKCNRGWSGPDCSCSTATNLCLNPYSNEICSNQGHCVCNHCECDAKDGIRYSGPFCDKCPSCSDRCEELTACVQCQMYQTGPFTDEECRKNCTHFTPIAVKTLDVDEEKNEQLCHYYDEDECVISFKYYYDDRKLMVKAEEERKCPPKVFLLGIVLGVIAAIVLVGLAVLLMWKLLTTIQDRREFARFEKERMMAKWDTGENPIYKQATSTFKNPTYAGKG